MVGQWGDASFLASCILLILSSISFTKVLARHVLALKDPRLGGGAGLGEAGGQGDAAKLLSSASPQLILLLSLLCCRQAGLTSSKVT